MVMPMIAEGGLFVQHMKGKPGYAKIMTCGEEHREMTVYDADVFSAEHYRSKLGLEKLNDMPPICLHTPRTCVRCKHHASFRCAACRSSYCSGVCQRKDWKRHVFVCTTQDRPDALDHLRLFLSRRNMLQHEPQRTKLLEALYADDDICRMFGFVNCISWQEVANLLCIWRSLLHDRGHHAIVSKGADIGALVDLWAKEHVQQDVACIGWILGERRLPETFRIPEWDRDYAYQWQGIARANYTLSRYPNEIASSLSDEERIVLRLYMRLLRPFNNIPGPYSPEWIVFGFVNCKTFSQRYALAEAYRNLASKGASLEAIARAWKTSTIPALLRHHQIEVPDLQLERLDVDGFGTYRITMEVHHALSGVYCACFRPKNDQRCHPRHETHLSRQSDSEYGFHGTNAWERWQLLNFYRFVFKHPAFDAEAMQRAKIQGRVAFEDYLEGIVPNYQRKIANWILADAISPKLGARLEIHGGDGTFHCECVLHHVWAPEGLDSLTKHRIAMLIEEKTGESEHDNPEAG
jgi:hypothetical protein